MSVTPAPARSAAATVTGAPAPPVALPDLFGVRLDARIVLAAKACVADRGLAATTVDEIAARAGCSRASVYRAFPGGRRTVLRSLVDQEVDGLLEGLAAEADAAPDVATAVAGALHRTATLLGAHPALQRLLATEPGTVLPYISFDGAAPLLAKAAAWGRAHLARLLPADEAEAVGEWAARVVLSHLHRPSDLLDLTDPATARHLVDAYLLPGLDPAGTAAATTTTAGTAAQRPPVA